MRFLLTKLSHFFIFFLGLSVTAPFKLISSFAAQSDFYRFQTLCRVFTGRSAFLPGAFAGSGTVTSIMT